ncbi:uncharacterized protein BO97DRAFT_408091 [Aspergillus homomorphus CBS 101889]|uniref:Uncharacterized protein n=1 Tax=Aspergillus homomorphus (strain CBS 101889) TaxID=1450537 RepID=A0A395HLV5_ASPHC|nr:hypothetical protein BO97DRAFT_408091 [Aspergillus homomorphus CBS 101889]RAL08837.1 hypothetical protein BO97DRAFT_408091 [Aspergillus homomorphus CBS 101889]
MAPRRLPLISDFSGGRNNRTIYTVCAVIAGGLLLHRYYYGSSAEKDALPFPYSSEQRSDNKKSGVGSSGASAKIVKSP